MTEETFVQELQNLLECSELLEEGGSELEVRSVMSFAERGLLTSERGLVVRCNGCEFQISVVRSG
jgi:hypothetical protein